MRKKELMERAEQSGAELVAEISQEKNRYFIRNMGAYYKITRIQFEALLDSGDFDRRYEIMHGTGGGFEVQLYRRR